jgi:hypothetical protein
MLTDAEYVLDQLDRHPNGRDAMQIISASLRDREVGLTVHSRISDLRAQGYVITCAIEGKTRKGRERYVYRLISAPSVIGSSGVAQRRHEPSAPQAAADGGNQTAAALVDIDGQLMLLPVPA